MTRQRNRRSPGEGSVWSYRMKNGTERWAIGYVRTLPDGTNASVTRRVGPNGEKWLTRTDAQAALRKTLVAIDKGEVVDPSRQQLGEYLADWLAGHPKAGPSTKASYAKNIRLHIEPALGGIPLNRLTTAQINKLYRQLETGGRADHREGEGLSPRTVRYVHTILSAALSAAVKSRPPLLAHNPAAAATPPSAKSAMAPEMHPWNAEQLAAFLGWSSENDTDRHAAWYVLATTGMRRGELLELRWRDVDLDAATVSVRRSVGVIRAKGKGAEVKAGLTKTGKPRPVDLDAATVAVLRAHFRDRGLMALQLARPDALVFGDHEGGHRHPERFSRTFQAALVRCRKDIGEEKVEIIRLHDLRHTHATLLLAKGVPVKVVSERLGHANATITLSVYAHVMPGNQRSAADLFAGLIEGASR